MYIIKKYVSFAERCGNTSFFIFSVSSKVQIREIFNIWLKHTSYTAAHMEIKNFLGKTFKTKVEKNFFLCTELISEIFIFYFF